MNDLKGRPNGTGGGFGTGAGMGSGLGMGSGRGRNSGGGSGPGGFCVCAKCGAKIPHQRGQRCTQMNCPKCGNTMVRDQLLEQQNKPL